MEGELVDGFDWFVVVLIVCWILRGKGGERGREIGGSDGARDFIGAVRFPAEEARAAARFHDLVLRRSAAAAAAGGGRDGGGATASGAPATTATAVAAACCSDIATVDSNLSVSFYFLSFLILHLGFESSNIC